MSYANPVIALLWLGLFSRINVTPFDYLVIGTVAIVVANLLIQWLRTSPRPALHRAAR